MVGEGSVMEGVIVVLGGDNDCGEYCVRWLMVSDCDWWWYCGGGVPVTLFVVPGVGFACEDEVHYVIVVQP